MPLLLSPWLGLFPMTVIENARDWVIIRENGLTVGHSSGDQEVQDQALYLLDFK